MWPLQGSFLTWLSLICGAWGAAELAHQREFQVGNVSGSLKWEVMDTKVVVEVMLSTTGFVGVGFAHSQEHNHSQALYDGFVGGMNGSAGSYGASYTFHAGQLKRNPEDRYQIISIDESALTVGGVKRSTTTLKLERKITTCFKESFDWRDVGDVAYVKVVMDPENKDLVSHEPTPKTIDYAEPNAIAFPITLFNQASNQAEVSQAFEGQPSFSVRHATKPVDKKFALCQLDYTTKDFTHYRGFEPDRSSTDNYDEGLQMMMAFQCDNEAIPTGEAAPTTRETVTDGCEFSLKVDKLNKKCGQILFVWSPGSEGEVLPNQMGIEANPKNSDGRRYIMLMTFYREALTADSSGMRLFYSNEPSYTKVGKMMVGHHISSKMVVMPGGEWVVEGVCPSSCSASADLTKQTEINVVGANIHHKSAVATRIKYSQVDGDSIIFKTLLSDDPANPKFQPARSLASVKTIKTLSSDIVVECTYDFSGRDPLEGGMDPVQEHCFGLLTYHPPIPIDVCTSIPTEVSLEVGFGMRLKAYQDQQERRRRRRRQAEKLIHGFWSRDLTDPPQKRVRDVLYDLTDHLKSKQGERAGYNDKLLSGEHQPICLSQKFGYRLGLKAQKIPLLSNGDFSQAPIETGCQPLQRAISQLDETTGQLTPQNSSALGIGPTYLTFYILVVSFCFVAKAA